LTLFGVVVDRSHQRAHHHRQHYYESFNPSGISVVVIGGADVNNNGDYTSSDQNFKDEIVERILEKLAKTRQFFYVFFI
jgi:hypothetical protein